MSLIEIIKGLNSVTINLWRELKPIRDSFHCDLIFPGVDRLVRNLRPIINLSESVQIRLIVELLHLSDLICITGPTINPHQWVLNLVWFEVEDGSNIVIQIFYVSFVEITRWYSVKNRRGRAIYPRLCILSQGKTTQDVVLDHKPKDLEQCSSISDTKLLLIDIKVVPVLDIDHEYCWLSLISQAGYVIIDAGNWSYI